MLEIKPQDRFKLNEEFVIHQIEELDKYWLFNIITGDIFKLNDVSMSILQGLREGKSYESLVSGLLQQFDVMEDRAKQDVQKILLQFLNEKIISQVEGD
jgi:hypothetical protein